MNRLLLRLASILLMVIFVTVPVTARSAAPAPNLVPLRVVAEAAGAKITWDPATQTATITARDGVVTVVTIGKATAAIDGQEVPVGRPVELVNGKAMIAAPFMEKALGHPVRYDPRTNTAWVDPKFQLAMSFVRALPHGKAAELRDHFSPGMATAMTPEIMERLVQLTADFGKLGRVVVLGQNRTGVHQNVDLVAPFERMPLKVTVRFTPEGQIDDYIMLPLQITFTAPSPAYANPASFIEKEVVIGKEWPLPGTLTLPIGKSPFPAVVLVHGSGPNDRDETILGTKVFRDLAHGLASRGIAVLRYDKRTLEHTLKSGAIPKMTVQQETVDDALEAVKFLAEQPGIDPQRVFVLGHSLGGYALPRILAQDTAGQIRGGIMMAAPNSFYDILVKQNELLVQFGSVPQQQADFIAQQVALLRDPAFNPEQPPEGYGLGEPYYWLDLAPKASGLLKGQTQPVLMLQGQRDFQVQASELDSFKADLAERTNITYKLYPKLNHLFTEGEGEISTLNEYLKPANIPGYVIEDIATWIQAQ